ncbi:MarR family winged helix-turn-helix transcriptional regulator [Citreimonas salinaria]|uniref:DNA-binding transcriptional regulator, MarR family n=1 Tax=Citreimonas salinaria TaxID=321339 RepID=A0A1H3L8W4_9RHOB|nr:MarR family transcriptional regulator [Citreimonas salinaria]SDY60957.1 DNA-binding transcriptional regulator, MarR family [Citreimonas salinaria]
MTRPAAEPAVSTEEDAGAGATGPLLPAGLEQDVGYRLRLAQILSYRSFEAQVTGYGAAPRYLGLLALIEGNPGQPQSRLAEAVGLKRSSLVPILDRLEADGLLSRQAAEGDRRSKAVTLTKRGHEVTEDLRRLAAQSEARALEGLDETARKALVSALDQIIANLR